MTYSRGVRLDNENLDPLFKNETVMRIVMYFQINKNTPLGIRELTKVLSIKSPTTVSTYFKKLLEVGIIKKNSNGKYCLTDKGKKYRYFYTSKSEIKIISGHLIPKFSLLLGFNLIGLFGSLYYIINGLDSRFILLQMLIIFFINFLIILREWYSEKKQFDIFIQK